MDKPTIIIDTREKQPYAFDEEKAKSVRGKLDAGDYSLDGLESKVAVERKSLADFVSTVLRGRRRFSKELRKLAQMDAACVVVEADLIDVISGHYRSDAHPNSILGAAVAIEHEYGVPVYFCSDRQCARAFVQAYLLRFHKTARRRKMKES